MLGVKVSGRQSLPTLTKTHIYKIFKTAESEGIMEIVNQVAIQAATLVMMALRDVEAGPWVTTVASHREPQR